MVRKSSRLSKMFWYYYYCMLPKQTLLLSSLFKKNESLDQQLNNYYTANRLQWVKGEVSKLFRFELYDLKIKQSSYVRYSWASQKWIAWLHLIWQIRRRTISPALYFAAKILESPRQNRLQSLISKRHDWVINGRKYIYTSINVQTAGHIVLFQKVP